MAVDAGPPSPVVPSVAFDTDGVQHGFLRLPYSRDDSAWGSVMVPIAVIRNGEGPTALLIGGNHGDEYEGPIALFDLARSLGPEKMQGRVIVLPALNYPAFRAGTRTSPIDRGNMNRAFPGRADGTVTEKIADYVTRELLPMADIVLDIHSGGRTLDFLPFAAAHVLADAAQEERCMEAVRAFAAPYSMRMREIDAVGMLDTTAESLGKTFITTELGGGGTSRAETVRIAWRGVRNLLHHCGILPGRADPGSTHWLDMSSADCFRFAEEDGLLEPCCDLGAPVRAGDALARVHRIDRTGVAPTDYYAATDGVLAGRHFPGLVKSGDCIAVVATVGNEE